MLINDKPMTKSDRYMTMQRSMPEGLEDRWLFGNETGPPLTYGFDYKRVVHPGPKRQILEGAQIQEQWSKIMSSKPEHTKRAAYIHIPFCVSRCLYCGFFKYYSDKQLEDTYIDALCREIQNDSNLRYIKERPIDALYIGGGTPSVLSKNNLGRLIRTLKQYLVLSDDCEFTLEASLSTLSADTLDICLKDGVNRVSFGIQSFDTSIRTNLGRRLDRESLIEKLEDLKSIATNYNATVVIDLMFGLPGQDMPCWLEDIETYLNLQIDSLDLYQINLFPDSPLSRAIQDKSIAPLPSLAEQALMFKRAIEILKESGQRTLSIIHWARNDRERNLYNSLSKGGYVTFPFGAGAGGKLKGATMFLKSDIGQYINSINSGHKPIMFMTDTDNDYRLYQDLIGQIDRGYIDTAALMELYGFKDDIFKPLIDKWIQRGFIEPSEKGYSLTIAGQFWYVNLTQAIIDWLQFKVLRR